MVRAWPFEQLLEVVRGTLGGLLTPLWSVVATSEPSCHYLFFFFVGMVGGAFAIVLVSLCLAFEAVENCPDRLLAQGVAGGDVEELLRGLWALMS